MAIKKRLDKRRGSVSDDEAAWLRGDHHCGFVEFRRDDELQALFNSHGDHDAFHWEPSMRFPEPVTGHGD